MVFVAKCNRLIHYTLCKNHRFADDCEVLLWWLRTLFYDHSHFDCMSWRLVGQDNIRNWLSDCLSTVPLDRAIYLLMRRQDRVKALSANRGSIIIFHEAGNRLILIKDIYNCSWMLREFEIVLFLAPNTHCFSVVCNALIVKLLCVLKQNIGQNHARNHCD